MVAKKKKKVADHRETKFNSLAPFPSPHNLYMELEDSLKIRQSVLPTNCTGKSTEAERGKLLT